MSNGERLADEHIKCLPTNYKQAYVDVKLMEDDQVMQAVVEGAKDINRKKNSLI